MLESAHRKYLWLDLGIGSVVVNLLLNAGIAWLLFRTMPVVPMWGQQSIAGDTLATTFFLPFFTCLMVTPMAARELRRGRFVMPQWSRSSHSLLGRLPAGRLGRSFVLGVLCLAFVGPVSVAVLSAAGPSQLDFTNFVLFKALFAGLLAAPVTPLVGLCALGDLSAVRSGA